MNSSLGYLRGNHQRRIDEVIADDFVADLELTHSVTYLSRKSYSKAGWRDEFVAKIAIMRLTKIFVAIVALAEKLPTFATLHQDAVGGLSSH